MDCPILTQIEHESNFKNYWANFTYDLTLKFLWNNSLCIIFLMRLFSLNLICIGRVMPLTSHSGQDRGWILTAKFKNSYLIHFKSNSLIIYINRLLLKSNFIKNSFTQVWILYIEICASTYGHRSKVSSSNFLFWFYLVLLIQSSNLNQVFLSWITRTCDINIIQE